MQDGKLDKHGRANDQTPSSWKTEYVDYSVQGEGLPQQQIPTQPAAPQVVPVPAGSSEEKLVEEVVKDGETEEEKKARKAAKKEAKKRKAEDEGDAVEGGEKAETEEERKARKKAKKEAKERRKSEK